MPRLLLFQVALTLLVAAACTSGSPTVPDAASAPAVRDTPPPSSEAARQEAAIVVSLACGRASAVLPDGAEVLREQARECMDPGYPLDLRVSGVAGAQSVHVIRRGNCRLHLAASERVPAPTSTAASEPSSSSRDYSGDVELMTPEGSVFVVQIKLESQDCKDDRSDVAATLRKSLRVTSLQRDGSHVHATMSSAGHGFELDAPPGFYAVSSGGVSDQYETSYQLRGPSGAWATIYTSWRSSPSSPAGPFVPVLLARRVRWRPTVDLATDSQGCAETRALGPDKRLKVDLTLCGSQEGRGELERLLRSVRLTPPQERE